MPIRHLSFSYMVNALKEFYQANAIGYIPMSYWRSDSPALQLAKSVYKSFGCGIENLSITPTDDDKKNAAALLQQLLQRIHGKAHLLTQIKIKGVPIGCALYESAQQRFQCVDVELNSETVTYLWAVLSRYYYFEKYFDSHSVTAILVSHSCYEFAIPLLVAISKGIPTYNASEHGAVMENKRVLHPWSDPYYDRLAELINFMSPSERRLRKLLARGEIEDRLYRGKLTGNLQGDVRMKERDETVKVSSHLTQIRKNTKKKVVFYTHALADAPYFFDTQDERLMTPLNATKYVLKILNECDHQCFVKMHPHPFPHEKTELAKILEKTYTNVKELPEHLTLNEVKEFGVDLIITGYGSVGFEAAYLDIPVLNYTEFSPNRSYSFNHHLSRLDDLCDFVATPERWPIQISKEEVVEFFALTEIGSSHDWLSLDKNKLVSKLGRHYAVSYGIYEYWLENFKIDKHVKIQSCLLKFLKSGREKLTLADYQ